MALDQSYLEYPARRYGMDHDRYDWSMLQQRPAVQWPEGARLAVWVNLSLQHFPLNQRKSPVPVPGGMTMPYPDLRHYSLRDYGNRVGVFRCLDAIQRAGVTPSFAVNTQLLEHAPALCDALLSSPGEILCHGWQMDCLHYGGMPIEQEREYIAGAVERLREITGRDIAGWLSPGKLQSENTPELLAEAGIRYQCDWVNDDMPYRFRSKRGDLVAMPLSTELEDRFILQNNLHSEASYVEQVKDACDFLLAEAERSGSGRMLAISLHPWLMGQPHRIRYLEEVLDYVMSRPGVWSASASDIVNHWDRQQDAA